MIKMSAIYYETDYLMHHGILGMKWGIRRFQNKDGSLTSAGRKRYDTGGESSSGQRKARSSSSTRSGTPQKSPEQKKAIAKKVAIGVGVTAAILAAGYGAKKVSDIREFKGNLRSVYGNGWYYDRFDVKSHVAANWDRYSLKTKSTLAKANKKGDSFKLEAFADDIKSKRTISTKIGDALDRRDEKKRVMREGKELYDNTRKAAQQAFLNKGPNSQAKIDAFKAIQDSAYSNRTFGQKVGTKLLAKATQGLTSKQREQMLERRSAAQARKSGLLGVKGLSDDELVSRIGRLKKEKEYLDLSSQTSKRSFGRSVAKAAGEATVKSIATAGAVYAGKKVLEATLTRAGFDGKQVLREMYPKKK